MSWLQSCGFGMRYSEMSSKASLDRKSAGSCSESVRPFWLSNSANRSASGEDVIATVREGDDRLCGGATEESARGKTFLAP